MITRCPECGAEGSPGLAVNRMTVTENGRVNTPMHFCQLCESWSPRASWDWDGQTQDWECKNCGKRRTLEKGLVPWNCPGCYNCDPSHFRKV